MSSVLPHQKEGCTCSWQVGVEKDPNEAGMSLRLCVEVC